jgi:hypothetical protein
MTKKQLLYIVRMNIANLLRDIDNIRFNLLFGFYKWKYKGAKNIPHDIIGKLLGPPEDMEAATAAILTLRELKSVSEKFGLVHEQTQTYKKFGELLNGKLASVEDNELFEKLFNAKRKRAVMFDVMVIFGDISQHKVEWMKKTNEWEELQYWLSLSTGPKKD